MLSTLHCRCKTLPGALTVCQHCRLHERQIPCIAHEDGPDLPLLPTALQDTPGLAYVVVTSPEAAKVFISGWKAAGSPVAISVACVGAATGETLEKGGVTPVFTPSKATGETLTAELPFPEGSSPPHVVLYPASAQASNQLEDGLKARGFHVRRLDTYDTVPARWDADFETAAQRVSVAAFGSPSAVKIWAARVGVFRANHGIRDGERERGAIAACIGNTSATACREAGWPEEAIFYPESPGIEAWAKAVRDALAAVETLCMAKPAAK